MSTLMQFFNGDVERLKGFERSQAMFVILFHHIGPEDTFRMPSDANWSAAFDVEFNASLVNDDLFFGAEWWRLGFGHGGTLAMRTC